MRFTKNIVSLSVMLIASLAGSAFAMTPANFKHPYVQISGGGSAFIAQSAHGRLLTYDELGVLQADDNLFSQFQQQNAFGPALNLSAGFNLNEIFRVALQLSYFQADTYARTMVTAFNSNDGTTTSYCSAKTRMLTANLYANLASLLPLVSDHTQPYLGLGLGGASNELGKQATYYDGLGASGVSFSHSQRSFAYKLMAGLNYSVTQHGLFNIEYAFVHAGNYVTGSAGQSIAAGVTFVEPQTLKFPIYANQLTVGFIYAV